MKSSNSRNSGVAGSIALAFCIAMASSHNAHAGRPLTVDDASVNELGGGHVEFWFARLPGQSNVWHVSPAYSPIKGFEVSALLSRDRTGSETTKAIQGKYLFTPSNPDGCNFGTSFGTGYVNELRRQTPYLSGLATCNGNLGSAHLNLGVSKAEGESSVGVWGIAFERELGGGVTGHIERFGQKHVHPSMQVGIRKEIMSGLQIDGTLGRYADDSIYSIGIKKTF